jgi:integrase/transposase-like protein
LQAGRKAGFHYKEHTWQSGLKNGKLDSASPAAQPSTQPPTCPSCHCSRAWKDGIRYVRGSEVQRYICRECGFRFSETTSEASEHLQRIDTKPLKRLQAIHYNRQVCVTETKGAKNLAEVESRTEKWAAGATKLTDAEVKGKIVEFSFWLLKQGYSETTIQGRIKLIKRLSRLGANLNDPESIKETIAKQEWSVSRKVNAVDAYTSFLQMQGQTWTPPIYKRVRKLPFIPTEIEIDQLIAGCSRRMATFLQLLKETGMRCGEACKLKWTDIDLVNNSVRVTPEKGGNPRILKISNKLQGMLNEMPKDTITVFNSNTDLMRRNFQRQRKRIAAKLNNSRIAQITFHTFRHFKATMEYHKTKDILHVKEILGHKNVNNTLIYTQLVNFKEDDFTAKVAHCEQEACQLIEAGFEYVCDFGGNKIFRKRK